MFTVFLKRRLYLLHLWTIKTYQYQLKYTGFISMMTEVSREHTMASAKNLYFTPFWSKINVCSLILINISRQHIIDWNEVFTEWMDGQYNRSHWFTRLVAADIWRHYAMSGAISFPISMYICLLLREDLFRIIFTSKFSFTWHTIYHV